MIGQNRELKIRSTKTKLVFGGWIKKMTLKLIETENDREPTISSK